MRFVMVVIIAGLAAACGGPVGATGKDVGAQCATDRDCTSRCTLDKDFGNGMCTKTCITDQDCPALSVCITDENGICAVSCAASADCNGFGRGFVCGQKSH